MRAGLELELTGSVVEAREEPAGGCAGPVDGRWHTLGAFRGCGAHERHHAINYVAVLESTGPAAVVALLGAADREGMFCSFEDEVDGWKHGLHKHCYAVLDIYDPDGDLVGDRCIPTREVFEWWTRVAELRATASSCPVDEPGAYAITYAAERAR